MHVPYLEGGLPVNKFISIEALKAGNTAGIYDGIDAKRRSIPFLRPFLLSLKAGSL